MDCKMSIAAVVAAALAAAAPAAPFMPAMPPIVVDVVTMSDVSPTLVKNVIEETQAVFQSAGVRFIWRRGALSLGTMHVLVSTETGPSSHDDGLLPIGWLTFENDEPAREIHLSYANAVRFLEDSREVVGLVDRKTRSERELLLGRLLGRALAHELGLYLLATKVHTSRGLLKGRRTAVEFFAPERTSFALDTAERRLIAARVRKEFNVARRQN